MIPTIPTYVSVSVRGHQAYTQEFLHSIGSFLPTVNCRLLDPHVLELDAVKRDEVFFKSFDVDIANHPDPCGVARREDFRMVKKAKFLIALADGTGSDGRGMEVQYALLKPEMGLNPTNILVLRHKETMDSISCMLAGVRGNHLYSVKSYSDIDDLNNIVKNYVIGMNPV